MTLNETKLKYEIKTKIPKLKTQLKLGSNYELQMQQFDFVLAFLMKHFTGHHRFSQDTYIVVTGRMMFKYLIVLCALGKYLFDLDLSY